jgi:hypothetical protein
MIFPIRSLHWTLQEGLIFHSCPSVNDGAFDLRRRDAAYRQCPIRSLVFIQTSIGFEVMDELFEVSADLADERLALIDGAGRN